MVLIEPGAPRPPKRPLHEAGAAAPPAPSGCDASKQARTTAAVVQPHIALVPGALPTASAVPPVPAVGLLGAAPPIVPANFVLPGFPMPGRLGPPSVEQLATVAAINDLQAASMPQQEDEDKKKPEPEVPAAFDKDALMRLAREAQQKVDKRMQPDAPAEAPPPPPWQSGNGQTGSASAAAATAPPGPPEAPPPPPWQSGANTGNPGMSALLALQGLQGLQVPPPPPNQGTASEAAAEPPSPPGEGVQDVQQEGGEKPAKAHAIGESVAKVMQAERASPPQRLEKKAEPHLARQPAREPASGRQSPVRFIMPDKADAGASTKPKKDATALTSILQQVQNNVARGNATDARRTDQVSLQQAFTMGGSAPSAASSSSSEVSKRYEALLERFDGSSAVVENRPALEREVLNLLPKLEPRTATELVVRTQAEDGMRTSHLLQEVASTLRQSPKLGSQNITRVIVALTAWVIATCGPDDHGKVRLPDSVKAFFTSASKELSSRLLDITSADLARIAGALVSVGHIEAYFLASVAKAALTRGDRLGLQELIAVAEAIEKAGYWHTVLLELLVKSLVEHIAEVLPADLVKAMRTLAACCVRDARLPDLISKRVLQGDGAFSREDVCALAWALCALDQYHEDVCRAALIAGPQDSAPEAALVNLYEIHLMLKTFHSSSYKRFALEDDAAEGLLEHYRKQRIGASRRLGRPTEKIHEDVAAVLREVAGASVHRQHQTVAGLSIDVAAMDRRGSSPVAVLEIDGPSTLLTSLADVGDENRRSSRVRGSVLLKRRLLQRHGVRMGVISEDVWSSMGDSREKRELLRELLKAAGVGSNRVH
mmetsp:Transcript_22623/g.52766  ORF Transcript_22623/g.52766 Transcript_22623/m.52766 type:complete len:829 (+) Transcript_22623:2-2488(+)